MKLPESTESDRSEWKQPWTDRLNIFGADIPVIVGVPKDEATDKISFSTFSRLRRMAEIIRENNRQKFKTTADVIRAAFYIGIHVLYVMFENGNGDQFGQGLYDFMQRNEAYYRKNQVLDDVVLEIKRLSEVMDKQYITWDEFLGNVETIIKQAPPEIMADAIEVSQKVLAAKYTKGSGIKISELFKNHHRKNMME
jgi:hypothetical protein